ncbi:UNVERIFIED_CONTAM: hypothetical protein FKN15_008981 [Acipenser sinensis]
MHVCSFSSYLRGRNLNRRGERKKRRSRKDRAETKQTRLNRTAGERRDWNAEPSREKKPETARQEDKELEPRPAKEGGTANRDDNLD